MSVITISREAGSGGTALAKNLAKTLGYRLVDKDTIGNLLGKYGLIGFSKVYDSAPGFWEGFDAQKTDQRVTTVDMMNKAIRAIAKRGNAVIVGRGGYVVLAGFSDVLNVRVQASIETRIRNVQEELKLADFRAAEKDVRDRDRIRALFMESAYDVKVDPATAFDLVVNTDKIPAEKAVGWIADIARDLDSSAASAKNRVADLEIDPVLATAVTEELG
jgi:cytidylate kinase